MARIFLQNLRSTRQFPDLNTLYSLSDALCNVMEGLNGIKDRATPDLDRTGFLLFSDSNLVASGLSTFYRRCESSPGDAATDRNRSFIADIDASSCLYA